MATDSVPGTQPVHDPKRARRAVLGSATGVTIEWYDFFLFGNTAAVVFAPLFFPGTDPIASQIGAFVAFALGFIFRPIGAVIFGQLGDRLGRRRTLIITLLVMGIATFAIGLLPPVASVGILAPIALAVLRAFQGIAAGGEWAAASTMAVESAPPEKRARYASYIQLGSPLGTLLSSGAVAAALLLPHEDFMAWGWRLPYLGSALLIAIALWLRLRMEESPEFEARRQLGADVGRKSPILQVFKEVPGRLLLGIGAYLYLTAGFFIITTFMIGYVTNTLKGSAGPLLTAITIGAAMQVLVVLISGRIADRIGAGRTIIIGYLITLVGAFPLFWMIDTKDPRWMTVGMLLALGLGSVAYAPIGALFRQLFPGRLLVSSMALSNNIGSLVSGFMPTIATFVLVATAGRSWGPALLLFSIAGISLTSSIVIWRLVEREKALGGADVTVKEK